MINEEESWIMCNECNGLSTKRYRVREAAQRYYEQACADFEKNGSQGSPPVRPKGHLHLCLHCNGTGIVRTSLKPIAEKQKLPHVAIIGGGIGGMALAVACLHRKIPFTLYERDHNFEARSQGYGLTIQQATKAIKGLGIFPLEQGIVSTRHVVQTSEGKIVAEWGMRNWKHPETKKSGKRTNIHIARQSLRLALLKQLGKSKDVQWGHQLINIKDNDSKGLELSFQVNGEIKHAKVDMVVGADGVRSSVRKLLIGDEVTPLHYLGCMVILGICPLADLKGYQHPLLDSATVFQTANGHERIYMMPYDSNSVMWQFSFLLPEDEAKALSAKGAQRLKDEACRRAQWHEPIPQILSATNTALISGYPVYDRNSLTPDMLASCGNITLIGDAAHPMSPFKGQGANQALIDALALAREITKGSVNDRWKEFGVRKSILNEFELEMLKRSANKVKQSAEAANYLHSKSVLYEINEPRGRAVKIKGLT